MGKEAWGRWGEKDEKGALNLIGPEQVKSASALVKTGEIYALAQPIVKNMPIPEGRSPFLHFMDRDAGDYAVGGKRPGGFQFSEDTLVMPGHLGTHIDALCHVWYDDELYNGHSANAIRSTTGAARCGADKIGPIMTRGVLLDVARARGGPLPKGEPVTAELLQEAAAYAGVQLRDGDVVLIRTGWLESHGHAADYFSGEPGIDVEAAIWLARQGVAVVGADNYAIEAIPFAAGSVFPVHQRLLRDFGVPLLEGLVLAPLAAAGAKAFLFSAAPLPIVGGSASPLCPIAVL